MTMTQSIVYTTVHIVLLVIACKVWFDAGYRKAVRDEAERQVVRDLYSNRDEK